MLWIFHSFIVWHQKNIIMLILENIQLMKMSGKIKWNEEMNGKSDQTNELSRCKKSMHQTFPLSIGSAWNVSICYITLFHDPHGQSKHNPTLKKWNSYWVQETPVLFFLFSSFFLNLLISFQLFFFLPRCGGVLERANTKCELDRNV